eukprot:s718_g3.t1
MQRQDTHAKQGTSAARVRPRDTVFAKMIQLPLLWLQKFLHGHHGGLQRERRIWDRTAFPQWYVRTDASTSGLGGILLDAKGHPVRWWASPIPGQALSHLAIPTGDPGLMTTYELLALLLSIIIWAPYLRKCRLGMMAQLDSESALFVAAKLASPHPKANLVAAELALRVEQFHIESILGQHWPNPINTEADALSRLDEGKAVPPRLQPLPRDPIPTSNIFLLDVTASDPRLHLPRGYGRTCPGYAPRVCGFPATFRHPLPRSPRSPPNTHSPARPCPSRSHFSSNADHDQLHRRRHRSCRPYGHPAPRPGLHLPPRPVYPPMLLHRAIAFNWKAVGLTAAQVRNYRRSAGPRPSQGGRAGTPGRSGAQRTVPLGVPHGGPPTTQETVGDIPAKATGEGGAPGPNADWTRPVTTGVVARGRDGRERAEFRRAKAQLRVCATWRGGQGACSHGACNPDHPVWDVKVLDDTDAFRQYLRRPVNHGAEERPNPPEPPPQQVKEEGTDRQDASRPAKKPSGSGDGGRGDRGDGSESPPPNDRGYRVGLPDYGPICCGCGRGGCRALNHPHALDHSTMVTRRAGGAGSPLLGSPGRIAPLGHWRSALRPHSLRGGSQLQGAGPLPETDPRDRNPIPEQGAGRPPPTPAGSGRKGTPPRREEAPVRTGGAEARHPEPSGETARESDADAPPETSEEEDVPEEDVPEEEEDREGRYRDIPSERERRRRTPTPEAYRENWRDKPECMNPHCHRPARGSDDICCTRCTETKGREHTHNCDARTGARGRGGPRGGGDRDKDPADRKGHPDHDRGSGSGGWRGAKKPSKVARDRERNMHRKGGKGKARPDKPTPANSTAPDGVWPGVKYGRGNGDEPIPGLTAPDAGTAYLRAQGYRSAELYASTAMVRHKASFPVSGALELAARDSARIARRGVGPPRGKEPAPVPSQGDPLYAGLCTGIWYLLRVSELVSLNLEDVQRSDGTGTLRTTLMIRKSKTDQEGAGELVARECTCNVPGASPWCPAHLVWTHACRRLIELERSGGATPGAPLFTDAEGRRLTQRAVTEAIEFVAVRVGQEIRRDGWARYGSHSLRVAGAMAAFEAGLQQETVKALGRWTSTRAMYAYLRGAPYAKAAWASGPMAKAIVGSATGRQAAYRALPMGQVTRSSEPDKGLEDLPETLTIRNSLTGLIHRVGKIDGPPAEWHTWCGWKWSELGAAGAFTLRDGTACARCFRAEHSESGAFREMLFACLELAAIPCGAFPAKLTGLYLWGNVKLIHALHHLRPGATEPSVRLWNCGGLASDGLDRSSWMKGIETGSSFLETPAGRFWGSGAEFLRISGGLPALLSHCYADPELPLLREAGVYAVRNATQHSPETRDTVRQLLAERRTRDASSAQSGGGLRMMLVIQW